jgi:N,N'-diacetyllegionaminate synthase
MHRKTEFSGGPMSEKVYIVAEIGINFNGSFDNCIRLINVAADAGCDAVKLQFFRAKAMYPKSAGRLDWKDSRGEYSYDIYDAVESFELPEKWIDGIIEHCGKSAIDLWSSVFDIEGADLLAGKGLKGLKLSSYVITHLPLIEHCAAKGLPLFLSTGGADLGETEAAVNTVLQHHRNVVVMHCSIKYPTALSECNMGVIKTFTYAFPGIPVGYSDHTAEVSDAPVQAVYLGAAAIEKHITLDKEMEGPDHFFALEPHELTRMVADVRQAERDRAHGNFRIDPLIYGSTSKTIYPHERYLREFAFMTLFAKRDIKRGETIRPSDVAVLRPGKKKHGLDPKYLTLFSKYAVTAKEDIFFEDPITWEVILR